MVRRKPTKTPSHGARPPSPSTKVKSTRTWGEMLGSPWQGKASTLPQDKPAKGKRAKAPKASTKPVAAPADLLDLQALRRDIGTLKRKGQRAGKRERHWQAVERKARKAQAREHAKQVKIIKARNAAIADMRGKQVEQSKKLAEALERKIGRAKRRQADAYREHLDSVEQRHGRAVIDAYQDLSVWAGRFESKKSSVVLNADGTLDCQIELPRVRSAEALWEGYQELLKELGPGYWLRTGWRFDIEPTARERYNHERFAHVQAYWQRAGNPSEHPSPAGKSVEQLYTAERILGAMSQPQFGHKLLGAVITVHWSKGGGRPDRR